MYSSVWRFMSARDAIRIPIAVFLSEGIAVLFLALAQVRSFETYSLSVFVIDAILCTLLIGASRLGERAISPLLGSLARPEERRRVLIVGAGRGGRSLLRELRETPGQQVIGFVDDDPHLRHRRIHGTQILGSAAEIDPVLARRKPDIVFVTIPDAPRERLDFVVSGCERAGITCSFVRRQIDLDPAVVLGNIAK
jgi:FlaA1/EpsC-like NDP-sugar epimerase